MDRAQIIAAIVIMTALAVTTHVSVAQAADVRILTGDTKLACEAMLCLSAGFSAPGECTNALARYFSIRFLNPVQTAIARQNFLNLCPRR